MSPTPTRTRPPYRQRHVGTVGNSQDPDSQDVIRAAVLRKDHRPQILRPRMGQDRARLRPHRRQHRAQHARQAANGRLSRRQPRSQCRNTLHRGRTLQLHNTRRMPSRNRTHPPDKSPHEIYRTPAVQRCPIRRRPDTQRLADGQIPSVRTKLLRPLPASGITCRHTRFYTSDNARTPLFQLAVAARYERIAGKMAQLFSQQEKF